MIEIYIWIYVISNYPCRVSKDFTSIDQITGFLDLKDIQNKDSLEYAKNEFYIFQLMDYHVW